MKEALELLSEARSNRTFVQDEKVAEYYEQQDGCVSVLFFNSETAKLLYHYSLTLAASELDEKVKSFVELTDLCQEYNHNQLSPLKNNLKKPRKVDDFNGFIADSDVLKFKELRKKAGTQSHMAKLLGLSDQTMISHLENGSGIDKRVYTFFLLLVDKHPVFRVTPRDKTADIRNLITDQADGSVLKEIRKSMQFSQEKLANLLKLSGKTLIYKYETNRQRPSKQTWTLLLLASNRHPDFYLVRR